MKFNLYISLLFPIALICVSISCHLPKADHRLKLIIDADTANEVDDLYAIVRAVIEPSINVIGITAAQFHTSPYASDTTALESHEINKEILQSLKRKDIPLAVGSNTPMAAKNSPRVSEATQFIIDQAHQTADGDTLHIAILGSCTNVASAIVIDPSIISKIAVHYIGFWHDPDTNHYDKKEFNSGNDTIAIDVLLDKEDLDFNVMTATTCQHLVFDRENNDTHLRGKNGIASILVDRWDTYTRWWTQDDLEKKKWIMWDVAIIEALIHPKWATKKQYLTPSENTQRMIGVYTEIDTQSMKNDFWNSLDRYLSSE